MKIKYYFPGTYAFFSDSTYKAVFLNILVFLSNFGLIVGSVGSCRPEVTN